MKTLVLSSTSPARKKLLEQLGLPFLVVAPNIDETPYSDETPQQLVERLAIDKAMAHLHHFPDSLIIGCDQVAVIKDQIVSKPDSHQHAVAMLLAASGQVITFYTGLCLINSRSMQMQTIVEQYQVTYKDLSLELIERYLEKEQPYQCAGSIKVEGLGIALMEKLQGDDPSTLTGLPLIALVKLLENEGVLVV